MRKNKIKYKEIKSKILTVKLKTELAGDQIFIENGITKLKVLKTLIKFIIFIEEMEREVKEKKDKKLKTYSDQLIIISKYIKEVEGMLD